MRNIPNLIRALFGRREYPSPDEVADLESELDPTQKRCSDCGKFKHIDSYIRVNISVPPQWRTSTQCSKCRERTAKNFLSGIRR